MFQCIGKENAAKAIPTFNRFTFLQVEYEEKTYEFKINTTENFSHLSNRVVTFVLGFSWMSLVALDIMRSGKIILLTVMIFIQMIDIGFHTGNS